MKTPERIDPSKWERREAYEYFSRMSQPFFSVTFRQDVTGAYAFAKAEGLSFYHTMIWACTEAVNAVDAFRTVMRPDGPARLPGRDPSFTVLRPGEDGFRIVTMPGCGDVRAFCREAALRTERQERFLDEDSETDGLIYFSCLPWLDLTAFTNERDFAAPGALDDSIPRIAWGRYSKENGRVTLGLSAEVNHRFADGLHVGRFAQRLTEILRSLEEEARPGASGG